MEFFTIMVVTPPVLDWNSVALLAVERLASIPQVLFVVVINVIRIYRANGNDLTEVVKNQKSINGWVVTVLLGRAFLKALPEILITASIFITIK